MKKGNCEISERNTEEDFGSVVDRIIKNEDNSYKEMLYNLCSSAIIILIISLVVEAEVLTSLIQKPALRLDAKSVSSESDPQNFYY
jgi:hypothetical protein